MGKESYMSQIYNKENKFIHSICKKQVHWLRESKANDVWQKKDQNKENLKIFFKPFQWKYDNYYYETRRKILINLMWYTQKNSRLLFNNDPTLVK